MSSGLEELLKTGKWSDLTLRCHGEDFPVHRAHVCARSKVLEAAACGGFKEAQTSEIELPDEELNALKRALSFLYSNKYDVPVHGNEDIAKPAAGKDAAQGDVNITPADGVSNTTNSDRILGTSSGDTFQDPKQAQDYRHDLFAHVDVYSFGDKYDISGLKDLAATKFKDCFVGLNPTSTTDFHVLVQKVYQCTSPSDSGLRKTLMDCCAQYVDDLLATPSFRDVVQNEDGVGLELLQKVSGLHGKSVREFCQRIRDLELVVGNLKLEKTQITNLYTVANQNYQDLDDKLDKAIASARAIEVCRNCEEVFGGCFDRSIRAPNSHIILRCKKCRCRHYL